MDVSEGDGTPDDKFLPAVLPADRYAHRGLLGPCTVVGIRRGRVAVAAWVQDVAAGLHLVCEPWNQCKPGAKWELNVAGYGADTAAEFTVVLWRHADHTEANPRLALEVVPGLGDRYLVVAMARALREGVAAGDLCVPGVAMPVVPMPVAGVLPSSAWAPLPLPPGFAAAPRTQECLRASCDMMCRLLAGADDAMLGMVCGTITCQFKDNMHLAASGDVMAAVLGVATAGVVVEAPTEDNPAGAVYPGPRVLVSRMTASRALLALTMLTSVPGGSKVLVNAAPHALAALQAMHAMVAREWPCHRSQPALAWLVTCMHQVAANKP
jgi:hypothetical protein